MIHIGYLACIPIAEVLVERGSSKEHITHIGYVLCIPVLYIVVVCKTHTSVEHTAQVGQSREVRLV